MWMVDRKGQKVLLFLFFFDPVCPELQIAVNVDAAGQRPILRGERESDNGREATTERDMQHE